MTTSISEIHRLPIFYWKRKPDISEISSYLQQRLHPNLGPISFLNYAHDKFGNNVLYSNDNCNEVILHGSVPARMIISNEGRNIIRMYPGLLRKIANPEKLAAQIIGQTNDREGVVMLEEDKELVIKYQFATLHIDGRKKVAYTPQTDALLIAQIMQKAFPELQIIQKLFATVDMSVSKYVRSLTLPQLEHFNNNVGRISDTDRIQLEKIFKDDEKKSYYDRFLPWYFIFSILSTAGLADLTRVITSNKELFPFELDHKGRYDFRESERGHNKLVTIPELYELWLEWKKNPDEVKLTPDDFKKIIEYNQGLYVPESNDFSSKNMEDIIRKLTKKQRKFLEKTHKTFHILELMIGTRHLDDLSDIVLDSAAVEMLMAEQKFT